MCPENPRGMGRNPRQPMTQPRRHGPQRTEARPGDPRTNTRPRGNGPRDRQEVERSARKLELVLG